MQMRSNEKFAGACAAGSSFHPFSWSCHTVTYVRAGGDGLAVPSDASKRRTSMHTKI